MLPPDVEFINENTSVENPDPHSQNSVYTQISISRLCLWNVGWRLFTITSTVKCCINYTHATLLLSVDHVHMACTYIGLLYSCISKNVKLKRRIFLSASFHLIFLKHSCISVDPDKKCIAHHRVKK